MQALLIRRRPAALLIILITMLALTLPQPAAAHGYIVRSIPEDRSTLERAPVRAQYWFSEGLEAAYSAITIRDTEGNVIAEGGVNPENPALLEARLPTNLPDGAYIAELRVAFASDGHVIYESRVFFVGEQVAGVSGAAASDQAVTLEVVWRTLVLSSQTLLFGALALYAVVLVPAWGNRSHRAGLLPPRVMQRLNLIVGAALVVALLGNVLALLQQAMVFFSADLGRVIEQGLWGVVRIGSQFGDVWNARMFLLLLIAVLHGAGIYLRERQPETVRAFWTANVWVAALVLGSLSIASHAAGSLLWPWVAIVADWAHTLAVGFWAGGVAALALVLPTALMPYAGEARRLALLAALRRFSPVAAASVAVVVATGIYSASNWIRTPGELATTYGGALGLKLVLVGLLLLVGLAHYTALKPGRYKRLAGLVERAGGFPGTLRLEGLLVVAVLASVGLLSATPLPRPAFIDEGAPAPTATVTLGERAVTVTVTPGGPGINSYDVVVTEGGEPVEDVPVAVRVADPARDWRGAWHTAEPAGDGLYVATGNEFDRAGDWWMVVEVGDRQAAFEWAIREDAAVVQSVAPNVLNVLALAGVVVALAYAAYPRARRFYERLDLSPAAVTVAVSATAATAVFLIVGYGIVQRAQAEYEATLNPPPQVVNTVLPDADSVERGGDLFADACGWNDDGPDWVELMRRLGRLRDEALFAMTGEGWRGLAACAERLDTADRWDVVNYLRTFEDAGRAGSIAGATG